MPALYLLDPPPTPAWEPFCTSRPRSELRAGAWLIRERWEAIADEPCRGIDAAAHLHPFLEDGVPAIGSLDAVEGPAFVGFTTFAPAGVTPDTDTAQPARLVNDEATVGWWVPDGVTWRPDEGEDWDPVAIDGVVLHGAYDLLTALDLLLVADVADFTSEGGDGLPDGALVIGDPTDVVVLGAAVEPGVTFDVRGGAIVVEQYVRIKSGTRLEGPLYIGPGTEVLGGEIRWSAIGPRCKIRGEMANSVLLGYANKAHDGFLGHSCLGRWVNLGAGTITSNLKNTYGSITLDVDGLPIPTERQFLGSLIGDHAKTAIGTLFGTGSVVGAGANVFGSTRPPRYVPAFAWGAGGDHTERVRRDGFLTTAERVLPRRQVEFTDEIRRMLETLYDHAAR